MPDDKPPRAGPTSFAGFDAPDANYFRMPVEWIDITAAIKNIAELKVVQYILRHTWGYREYGIKKHITVDEFVHGRRRRDGSRMDKGTGLAERSVRYGIADALAHGFIEEQVDASDRARIKKFYSLRMRPEAGRDAGAESADDGPPGGVQDLPPEVQRLHPEVQALHPRGATLAPRSEIDTLEQTSSSTVHNPSRNPSARARSSTRRATHPLVSEGKPGGAVALEPATAPQDRRAPAPQAAPSAETTAQGMRRVGEILQDKGIASTRAAATSANGRAARSAHPTGQHGVQAALLSPPAQATDGLSVPPINAGEREAIRVYVAEFAELLHDQAAFGNSLARVCNLYARSGLTMGGFTSRMEAAKQESQRRRLHDPGKRFAYFCRVLADQCGLREVPAYTPPAAPADTARDRLQPRAASGRASAGSDRDAAEAEGDDEEIVVWLPENTNAQALWQRTLRRLQDQVTRPVYETYLAETAGSGIADGRLVVTVPDDVTAEWLAVKLYPMVRQALEVEEGLAIAVEFTTSPPQTAAGDDDQPKMPSPEPLRGPRKPPNRSDGPNP